MNGAKSIHDERRRDAMPGESNCPSLAHMKAAFVERWERGDQSAREIILEEIGVLATYVDWVTNYTEGFDASSTPEND